jgi:hypothetical protein
MQSKSRNLSAKSLKRPRGEIPKEARMKSPVKTENEAILVELNTRLKEVT